MSYPRGRLFQSLREMRERGGGVHQQTQNLHAARVRQKFDLVKGLDGLNCFHLSLSQLRENLIVSIVLNQLEVKHNFYLTCPLARDIKLERLSC